MPDTEKPARDSENRVQPEDIPIGIARLRREWDSTHVATQSADQPHEIVFPEVDGGGAGVGDYELTLDDLHAQLALSDEALERLVNVGEIDSVLVQAEDGTVRRLISKSSIGRFLTDSQIDPDAIHKAAEAIADREIAQSLEDVRMEVRELRNTQSKILQQMKDILLLEVRNLKEQERDLASFVYELSEKIDQFDRRRK